MSIGKILKYGMVFILLVHPGVPLLAFGLNVCFLFIFHVLHISSHTAHVLLSTFSIGCSGCVIGLVQRRIYPAARYYGLMQIPVILLLVYSSLIEIGLFYYAWPDMCSNLFLQNAIFHPLYSFMFSPFEELHGEAISLRAAMGLLPVFGGVCVILCCGWARSGRRRCVI